MSRWLSDGWSFTLAPDGIAVARTPHSWRPGRRPASLATRTIPVAAGAERASPWAPALAALAKVVADVGGRGGAATVVLANAFVRYALVPWSDLVESDEEGIALCRHHLHDTYGAAAERWQLRIDPTEAGTARLVSAVEPELLDELRRVFAASRLRLVSIQPRLMALCNGHRQRLGRGDAWLALVEPGALCLALVQRGHFAGLRQLRLGEAWPADLVMALDRESLLVETAVRRVFVAANGVAPAPWPSGSPWLPEWLEPAPAASTTGQAPPLALAPGG